MRILCVLLLLASVAVAEPVAKPVPVELVLWSDKPLLRVNVVVVVDGQPLSALWDDSFAKLYAYTDRNSDGSLDAKEVGRLPSALALRQALGNGFTPPIGTAPTLEALDTNKDGKVTLAEMTAYYRRAGLGNALLGVGRLPASKEIASALLKHLDKDGDGTVSDAEWQAAPETLKKLDANDDELIGVGELLPKVVYPGAAASLLLTPPTSEFQPALTALPLVLLPVDTTDTHWTADLLRRRDANKNGTLSVAETGFAPARFAKLDANQDGELTPTELAAWRNEPADHTWTLRLDTTPTAERLIFAGTQTRLDGWAAKGKMPDTVASSHRQLVATLTTPADPDAGETAGRRRRATGLGWLVPVADRNDDGQLDSKELDQWLDLQAQLARGQVLVSVYANAGLLEALDTNHDGALSIVELRRAWARLGETGYVTAGKFNANAWPTSLLLAASHGYPQTLALQFKSGPAWFQAMDRNGDGVVSRREFTGPADIFAKLDTDNDDLLSPEEASKQPASK